MRAFFYGLIGIFVTLILSELLNNSSNYIIYNQIIIQSVIICGCTGAIVSAIKSKEENIETKDDNYKTKE